MDAIHYQYVRVSPLVACCPCVGLTSRIRILDDLCVYVVWLPESNIPCRELRAIGRVRRRAAQSGTTTERTRRIRGNALRTLAAASLPVVEVAVGFGCLAGHNQQQTPGNNHSLASIAQRRSSRTATRGTNQKAERTGSVADGMDDGGMRANLRGHQEYHRHILEHSETRLVVVVISDGLLRGRTNQCHAVLEDVGLQSASGNDHNPLADAKNQQEPAGVADSRGSQSDRENIRSVAGTPLAVAALRAIFIHGRATHHRVGQSGLPEARRERAVSADASNVREPDRSGRRGRRKTPRQYASSVRETLSSRIDMQSVAGTSNAATGALILSAIGLTGRLALAPKPVFLFPHLHANRAAFRLGSRHQGSLDSVNKDRHSSTHQQGKE